MSLTSSPTKNEPGPDIGLELIQPMERRPYGEFREEVKSTHYHFYLNEGVVEPNQYMNMIHTIRTATQNDLVTIHLNTPGGDLATGVQLINAMQSSEATIQTSLEGCAFSLGTVIFLAGDRMIANSNCLMMFHNFSGGMFGKGNEMASELSATIKWFQSFAKRYYIPFLTEAEFDRICRGEDMWFNDEEIMERLIRVQEHLTREANNQQREVRKEAKRRAEIEKRVAAELALSSAVV